MRWRKALLILLEQRVIAHHARYLMESRSAAEDEIDLPGERLVRLRGTRVSAGSEIAGIVVEVREAQERSALRTRGNRDTRYTQRRRTTGGSSIASSRTGALGQDSHSPLWRRACSDVADALNKNESLLVIGEPGTGKFTLIATTFHHIHPGSRTIELTPTTSLTTVPGTRRSKQPSPPSTSCADYRT